MASLALLLPPLLVVAIGVFLVSANKSIPFANGPNCDTWYSFGRFFLGDQPDALQYSRDASRVPEFLVGYLLDRVFRGVRVEYTSYFIFFVSGSLAVYYAAKRLFGTFPAYVALVFFSTQPLVIANYSVTYTEAATSCSALAFAFAIYAATASRFASGIATLLAGLFWGAAIHAHLESLTMNFIVALYCIDWNAQRFDRLLRDAITKWLLLLLGAIAATVVFAVVNVTVFHGEFLFFVRQFAAVFTVQIAAYDKANWYLLGGRGAILLVGIGLLIGQGIWIRRASGDDRGRVLSAYVPFAVLLVVQLAYTFFDHGLALQYDYWFVWILAPLALLVASLAYRSILDRKAAVVAIVAYVIFAVLADFGRLDLALRVTGILPALVAACMALPLLVWLIPGRPRRSLAVAVLALIVLSATIRPEKIGLPVWDTESQHDAYVRIDAGMDFLAQQRFPTLPKFWLDARCARWETIAYPRAFGGCLVQNALPELIPDTSAVFNRDAERFAKNDYLVLVPTDQDELHMAIQALKVGRLVFREIDRTTVSYKGLAYLIVVGQVK
jgi:hypothetical protein